MSQTEIRLEPSKSDRGTTCYVSQSGDEYNCH